MLEQDIDAAEQGKQAQDSQVAKVEQVQLKQHEMEAAQEAHKSAVGSAQDVVTAALIEQKAAREAKEISAGAEEVRSNLGATERTLIVL